MHIALLGGSFNPPHLGHQMICLWALSTGRVDRVWLVPCGQHPFRKPLLALEQRLAMCEQAAALFGEGLVQVCDVEARLESPNRTLETVVHLTRAHPEHRFSLLIGADILQEKDSWHRFDEIERRVDILVLGREGYPPPPVPTVMLPAISSTEIRQHLQRGRPVAHLLPAAVLGHIREHRLYGADDDV